MMPGVDARPSVPDLPQELTDWREAPSATRVLLRSLGLGNISALYVLAALLMFFAFKVPDTFFTQTTLQNLLTQNAVILIVALGVLVPMAAGVFDVSVGGSVSMGSSVIALLTAHHGYAVPLAMFVTLLVGIGIGLVNSLLVVVFRIDSFVATLASSSVLLGLATYLTGGQSVIGLPSGFTKWGTTSVWGVAMPVYVMLVLAVVVWYVVQHTPWGRNLYATGGGREAARLAGVRTDAYMSWSLVVSATMSVFAGTILASQFGSGSATVGSNYLLPAFAAVFFGATQFKRGRFNVWGTMLAVYVIGAGVQGFNLIGASFWAQGVFTGVVLAVAVGAAVPRSPAEIRNRLRLGRRAS